MRYLKRGFQNLPSEPKHTRTPLTSVLVHTVYSAAVLAAGQAWVRRKVPGAPESPQSQLLGCSCFLFFTERLYWARLYPWQASNMNTFIVLFFRLLLGTIKNRHQKVTRGRFQHCTNLFPQKLCVQHEQMYSEDHFRKESASSLFQKWLSTYFLSQHLLSGFIMYRRIPWRKA